MSLGSDITCALSDSISNSARGVSRWFDIVFSSSFPAMNQRFDRLLGTPLCIDLFYLLQKVPGLCPDWSDIFSGWVVSIACTIRKVSY